MAETPPLNRRDFLKLGAAAACAAGLAPVAGVAQAEEAPYVVVAKGEAEAATKKAVEMLGGIQAFVKPGHKVVLKPNFSFAQPPEMATTTNPAVVKALAALCWEAGAKDVLILDNPLRDSELCLETSGIKDVCLKMGKNMAFGLQKPSFYKEVEIPGHKVMPKNRFMKDLLEADVLISIPVAKSHGSAGVSLSMKNLMGVIYDREVMHSRYDLHQAIVDMCRVARPQLAVIDATRVLTTNGPGGPGKVVQMDMIVASRDFVAADAQTVALCEWWGRRLKPENVQHIKLAHEQGLGRMDVDKLRVKEVQV